MTVNITVGHKALVEAAEREIESISPTAALEQQAAGTALIIDIRDVRELERTGRIPRSEHMPRGMLEFWVDPESPYFKPVFHEETRFILHCASGWRSALAAKTLQDMGLQGVAHIAGGFGAWQKAELPVEAFRRGD